MNELRPAIIRAHENGKEYVKFLDIEPSTVSRKIKRFEETGSNENRKREKTARSRRNIEHTKGMIKRNPSTKVNSTRKLAKKLHANCLDFISVDTHRNNDGEWPPNSIDLNPLDYSVWRILEEKACAKPHPNVESLKQASFEEGMERNHLGNFDQDRGKLSEATKGLHGCKRRTF